MLNTNKPSPHEPEDVWLDPPEGSNTTPNKVRIGRFLGGALVLGLLLLVEWPILEVACMEHVHVVECVLGKMVPR